MANTIFTLWVVEMSGGVFSITFNQELSTDNMRALGTNRHRPGITCKTSSKSVEIFNTNREEVLDRLFWVVFQNSPGTPVDLLFCSEVDRKEFQGTLAVDNFDSWREGLGDIYP